MRRKQKTIHLKWKIFGFLLGFCGLLLMILWLFQTIFLYDMYKYIRKNEMDQAISVVEKNINRDDLQVVFDEIAGEKEILITGADSFKEQNKKPKDDKERNRQETLTQTKAFEREDGSRLLLTFHALITPVDATVSTLHLQLLVITGMMVLLSVMLALFLARRISKPIEEINRSAKVLAKGVYGTHFKGNGYVEIEELSDTLNKASYELSRVDTYRKELMANIAHDLRTPLSLIYSYAEMMNDFPEEILPEQTQVIMDEVNRLGSLVNDVFEISKLETGTMTLHPMAYNLTNQIDSTIKRIEALVKKDGFECYFEYSGEVMVWADKVKIDQVFYNLLLNAIHYSGENKKITIYQNVRGDYVTIGVKDLGEGIPQDALPDIWDRYYKLDKKHKRTITGSGLGLSIVKGVIELHKGYYGVESELGKGSDFWFQIPMMKTAVTV